MVGMTLMERANLIKKHYMRSTISLAEAIITIRNLAKEEYGVNAVCQEEIAKILMSNSRTFKKLKD